MNIPKPIRILDTTVHPIHFQEVIRFADDSIKTRRRAILLPMNIHILVELSKNLTTKKRHEAADIIFCDGVPLVWLSRLGQIPLPERVSGTDLVETLLKKPYKIFLLGSTPDVLSIMKRKYSGVCGTLSPLFKKQWGRNEVQSMLTKINASGADILFVALGPLKQESWILDNFAKTHVPITIAVGSALDILSGKTPRSPHWIQFSGLEWAWRIILEPKRLFLRYVRDVSLLARLITS